ncbi:uncharacterized protein LOC131680388 [Topomyia yanbarensis]|uniref:uncharacterized protein LOC131680388 n=1 Tax=Topomyia yanbarensis TaxID=2498891 RepID=UPI00273AB118|nr:uncharacterized protein LOC131680388 [Topomyia yanbarensis]
MVSEFYSDNATNFVGARSEFQELYRLFNSTDHQSKLSRALADDNISWTFIPPHSPNFGGLWEAGVKSVKKHLKKLSNGLLYTYEELNTVLVQIEAILNSRPLTAISDDINDFTPLTPAHFLIGDRLTSPVELDLIDAPQGRLKRWQSIQQLKQRFWKRWSSEYLHHLQQRRKWQTSTENIKEGALVLLKEDNLPPMKWALGRIVSVHPGTDKKVRVATVKTTNGEYVRAISKICPLPIIED